MRKITCDLCGRDTPADSTMGFRLPINSDKFGTLDLDWDFCGMCATTKLAPWLEKNRHKGVPPRDSAPKTLHG